MSNPIHSASEHVDTTIQNWSIVEARLVEAVSTSNQQKLEQSMRLVQTILARENTALPSWWQEHKERFLKLTAAIQSIVAPNIVAAATQKVFAVKVPLDAQNTPLSCSEFPGIIQQCITNKDWKNLVVLLERISQESQFPAWWTDSISNSIENSLLEQRNPLYILEEDSIPLYARLHWKQGVYTLVHRSIVHLSDMKAICNYLGEQFLQELFQSIPLSLLEDLFEPEKYIANIYAVNIEAASIVLQRLVAATGKKNAPSWWNDVKDPLSNRYTICSVAIAASDKTAVSAIAQLPLCKHSRAHSLITSCITQCAAIGWQDVCKLFLSKGASLFSVTPSGDFLIDILFAAFPNSITQLYLPETWTSIFLTYHARIKMYCFEYIERKFGTAVLDTILKTPIYEDHLICHSFLRKFICKKKKEAFTTILARWNSTQPTYWKNPRRITAIFAEALKIGYIDIADSLLADIHINNNYLLQTPLGIAAEARWKKGILTILARDAEIESAHIDLAGRKTTSLECVLASNCVTTEEIVNHISLDGVHALRNLKALYQHNRSAAQLLQAKLTQRFNAGHPPHLHYYEDIVSLYTLWGTTYADALLSSLPINGTTIEILSLCLFGNLKCTRTIFPRVLEALQTTQNPNWWNDTIAYQLCKRLIPTNLEDGLIHRLNANQHISAKLTTEEIYAYTTALLPHLHWNRLSSEEINTICAGALRQQSPSFIIALVKQGVSLTIPQFTRFLSQFGKTAAQEVLKHIALNSPVIFPLMLFLIRNTHPDTYALFEVLFLRIKNTLQTSSRPSWCSKKNLTELFFLCARKNTTKATEHASTLVTFIDTSQCDMQNKNRTPLMIALDKNFSSALIELLLPNSNLFHVDAEGKSALEILLEHQLYPANAIQACLLQCGLPAENVTACTNVETFTKYIEGAHTTSTPPLCRILLYLLLNKKTELQQFLHNASLEDCIAFIPDIEKIAGMPLVNRYIDTLFKIDETHFATGVYSQKIPPKAAASMEIDAMLLKLYDDFAQTKNYERRQALINFVTKVKNRTPYIGTPPTGSSALKDFYETIDNASCNSIHKLASDMLRLKSQLQKIERAQIDEQLNKINEQLNKINQFLDACIEAAPLCGGAFLSTATQYYSQIVLERPQDLKTNVETLAGMIRQDIVEQLANSATMVHETTGLRIAEPQTTHLYYLFLRENGRKYGIPGYSLVNFDDACVYERHRHQAEQIERDFVQRYTPSFVLNFMQRAFEEAPQHGLFITKMCKDNHSTWAKLYVPKIIKDIKKRFSSFPATGTTAVATALQQAIAAYLMSTYFITLENEALDVRSLETLEQALFTHPQLYAALNTKGKSFTKEALLALLVECNIINKQNGA